ASPSEPPSKPTPANVTFFHRTGRVSGFKVRLSSWKLSRVSSDLSDQSDGFFASASHLLQNDLRHFRVCAHDPAIPDQLSIPFGGISPGRLAHPQSLLNDAFGIAKHHRNILLSVHSFADEEGDNHNVPRLRDIKALADFRSFFKKDSMDASIKVLPAN